MTTVKTMLAREERRIEALRLVDDLVQNDPVFVADLMAALGARGAAAPATAHVNGDVPGGRGRVRRRVRVRVRVRSKTKTNFQRIREWFRENGNEWATVDQVVAATGGKKASIGFVIYARNKEAFESRDDPKGIKAREYRLKAV